MKAKEVDYAKIEARILAHLSSATSEEKIDMLGLERASPERKLAGLALMYRFLNGEPK